MYRATKHLSKGPGPMMDHIKDTNHEYKKKIPDMSPNHETKNFG